ncbi:MAG: type 4a pilus biogenesis protein PilO [Candidatus Marinimicrobia bacterium]|nr:type 4a pilus biogenesis protein PilO [Candidatus Neomarinimicrobiota bacterium]MBT4734350.1 type 4a pilus biogenesis protein PilO [Candidatus Neomarinimicrobiota bacterium]MBT5068641.1 type 4a pilus biogenesis protein PilO [Candidatus Neomarinimicrobiota bacterium]
MAEKRNLILLGIVVLLSISFFMGSSMLIGEKPLTIKMLEQEQEELNENLISAQILASKLDRVYTLFQENLALSLKDSLAEDASMPFLRDLTDKLEGLNIEVMSIKPRKRIKEKGYYRSPYELTVKCSFDQFGEFLTELERSPRLVNIDDFIVKNGIERVKSKMKEEDLVDQVFELGLSTITLVKGKGKIKS